MFRFQYLFLGFILLLNGCASVHQKAHSHNDYRQEQPLLDALTCHFVSAEADILLKDERLFIGHDRSELDQANIKDLEELYLRPLFKQFNQHGGFIYKRYHELFYLWIDIKYDGARVFEILQNLIQPYRTMLFSNESNRNGKVMLILSGDRPIDLILADSLGYLHLDGRPEDLAKNFPATRVPFISQHIKSICEINNEQFFDETAYQKLKAFVHSCHQQDKKVRLWATPENERVWSQLIDAKVDLINTDSLEKLANYLDE